MTVLHIVPLKRIAKLNARKLADDTDRDMVLSYLDISSVDRGFTVAEPETMTFGSAPSRARRLVANGDTIISTVRTYLRAVWPVSGDVSDLVVSTGFAVLSPTAVDSRYLGWIAQSNTLVEEVVARSVGVSYPAINPSEIGDIKVPLPDKTAQCAIADFLDRETARIDALITAKRRMIELTHHRVVALMAESVPATPGRTIKLGQVLERIIDYRGATPDKVDDGVTLLTASNVIDGQISLATSHQFVSEKVYSEWMQRGKPRIGDLLLTTEAPLGEVAILVDPNVALAQRLMLLRPRQSLASSEYLRVYLRSPKGRAELLSRASGSTVMGVRTDRLRGLPVHVPSLDDQRQVVAAVRRAEDFANSIRDPLECQIDLLVEHRQALITAAVTGELNVAVAA